MNFPHLFARFSPLSFALPLLVGCGGEPLADEAELEAEAISTSEEAISTGVSLVVNSRSTGLVAENWTYREVATRKVWGCYDYDVLQRSGWFLATWYRTYPFTASAAGPVVKLDRTVRAYACGARMDEFNYVNMSLATPTGPVTGSFRVVPGGTSTSATVTCKRVDYTVTNELGTSNGSQLECTDARVKVPSSGAMTVAVTLVR